MRPVINSNQKIKYRLDIDEASEWISVTPGEMARSTFFYVQEAGHFHCGPSYFTERESLHSFLIKLTMSGRGRLEYRGKTCDLERGDAFFLKCDEYQRYRTEGDSWENVWLHFNGTGSPEYFRSFYETAGGCVVRLPNPAETAETIKKIISLYKSGGLYADIVASRLISELLCDMMIAAAGVYDGAVMLPAPVRTAISVIESDYRQNITLEYLSRCAALNKQYLHKLFKKHMGMTPYAFLTAARINRAKELLRFGDMYIEEIAVEVGMDNTSHFIKVFKRATGVTPNSYRKMWSNSTTPVN